MITPSFTYKTPEELSQLTEAEQASYNAYQDLFRQMESYKGLQEGSIQDLHTYLYYLDSLIHSMSTNLDTNAYNLLRLPLEEPVFEIDPNKRTITVPPQFKENGLTIQGDKLAEIVWFKMPRFFDLTDFYTFSNDGVSKDNEFDGYHTYIEWYNPGAKENNEKKGIDLAYAMTCDENYIYFGWPLGDKVSKYPGTIQFSVRFLGVANGEIRYNFATQIQTCAIKSTLNFNVLEDTSYVADTWEELIYTRPVYSGVVNSIQSLAPVVVEGLNNEKVDLDDDGEGNLSKTLKVVTAIPLSVAPDKLQNYTLQFVWRQDLNGDGMTNVDKDATYAQNIHEPVDVSEDEAYTTYSKTKAMRSEYVVKKVGKYTVLLGCQEKNKAAPRYVYTGVVEVPGPTNIQLQDSSMPRYGYTSHVFEDSSGQRIKYHKAVLKVSVPSHFAYSTIDNTVTTIVDDKLTYSWYVMKPVLNDGIYVDGDPTLIPGATTDTYQPLEDGKYFVQVSASRNGETVSQRSSIVSEIKQPPQDFTKASPALDGAKPTLTLAYDNDTHKFTATLTGQNNPTHKLIYIWMRSTEDDPYKVDSVEIGGEKGVNYNNNAFVVTEPGKYRVAVREIVFDKQSYPDIDLEQMTLPGGMIESESVTIDADLHIATTVVPADGN